MSAFFWLFVLMKSVICVSCRQDSVASCCGDLGIQGGDQVPDRKGWLGEGGQARVCC